MFPNWDQVNIKLDYTPTPRQPVTFSDKWRKSSELFGACLPGKRPVNGRPGD